MRAEIERGINHGPGQRSFAHGL